MNIRNADSIGKCTQFCREIISYLKNSFSGYLAVGFDTENPVSFILDHPQPPVLSYFPCQIKEFIRFILD